VKKPTFNQLTTSGCTANHWQIPELQLSVFASSEHV